MSIHIGAKKGRIATTVWLPGDPLRAAWIAEEFLRGARRYSTVRNMFGYTGRAPEGQLVSVQGSGMGMPGINIYGTELIKDYGVRQIIRLGTCGGFQEDMKIGDVVLAQGACSDSANNRRRFRGMDFAPISDFDLLYRAYEAAKRLSIPVRVGNILATDRFYKDEDEDQLEWKIWAKAGVLAVEMESAELFTIAAKRHIQALTICTVSDVLPTGENASAEERERTFRRMVQIALEILPQ